MTTYLQRRPNLSTYFYRLLSKSTVLHIDTYAYLFSDKDLVIFETVLSAGGRKPVRTMYFAARRLQPERPPIAVTEDAALRTELALMDPARFTSVQHCDTWGRWGTEYHHQHMLKLVHDIPLPDGYRRKSVAFHYFVCPDHNPAQGFVNWYVPRKPLSVRS